MGDHNASEIKVPFSISSNVLQMFRKNFIKVFSYNRKRKFIYKYIYTNIDIRIFYVSYDWDNDSAEDNEIQMKKSIG